jgi:NADPH:quinone reductase-like Zn-dependent oxidoreductase
VIVVHRQLANALGAADLVGICSGKNEEMVKEAGAKRIVDYTNQKYHEVLPVRAKTTHLFIPIFIFPP